MSRVHGKVALITGAARGQGRSHAVRLAEEGADIVAFDLCADIDDVGYSLATPADLDETGRLVEKAGRSVLTRVCDVRDRNALDEAVAAAVAEFGRIDVVVANAGICPLDPGKPLTTFADAVDVDLVGVLNTVHAALPHVPDGASIILTGSVAALVDGATKSPRQGPGGIGYAMSKQMLGSYAETLALQGAPRGVRCNVVHPTNVNTDMLQSPPMFRQFRPDLEEPTAEDARHAFPAMQAMPVPWIEPQDVSHAVVYLASDESRYVTGVQLKVDAGALLKR
jgi:SDR family mycofactocin-dependent oxidoreductase